MALRILRIGPLKVLVVVCGVLVACSGITGPNSYGLPDPDLSLDPAAIEEPKLIYACGEWVNGPQPEEERIFVDVAFARPSLTAEPDDRPSSRHLAALAKHGGKVAYAFHVPAVRAWVTTKDIPSLSEDKAVVSVFRVANLRRYDWYVNVAYRSREAYTVGIVKYGELGGRVDYRFNTINAIGGLIPDRSVETIRRDPQTDFTESSPPFPYCQGGV